MKINKQHGLFNIQKRSMSVKYIVLHYTGSGTSAAGSALANCKYFAGGDRQASAHYFVDDSGIWEYADPKTHFTWHCGDGGGKYGISNANSIGIEVCQNYDVPYTEKEIGYLSELVPYLMKQFGVPADRVVRHYDASRKQCPLYYAKRSTEWTALRNRITGKAKTGWSKENGAWYYYENGTIDKIKWVKYKEKWFYLGEDGKMYADKWLQWKGAWYYLKSDGAMATSDWQKASKGWCYLGADGKMLADTWLSWKDNSYFLKADGYMATGNIKIIETFDGSGKWVEGRQA